MSFQTERLIICIFQFCPTLGLRAHYYLLLCCCYIDINKYIYTYDDGSPCCPLYLSQLLKIIPHLIGSIQLDITLYTNCRHLDVYVCVMQIVSLFVDASIKNMPSIIIDILASGDISCDN
jgi:hypothetical protein